MPTSFTEIKIIDKYKTPSAQARWWFFLSEAKEISGCPHKMPHDWTWSWYRRFSGVSKDHGLQYDPTVRLQSRF